MEHTPGNLLIIADDLGLHPAVNDGIIFLLKNRRITGASLMANGEAFDDAISRLKHVEYVEGRPPHVGVHLVLVEEKSLTGIKLPKNHKIFFIKYILGLIKNKDIEKEIRAQLEKCLSSGIVPSFLNSHQHLHLLPGILNIVTKVAKENGINYIRLVNEPLRGRGRLFRKTQLLFLRFLSGFAKRRLNKAGLKYNDIFIGFLNAGNLKEGDLEFAKQIKNGLVELGCHPGQEDGNLRGKYKNWGNYNWQKELDLLA